jgi:hypothetical protein
LKNLLEAQSWFFAEPSLAGYLSKSNPSIPKAIQKSGIRQGGALNFYQAQLVPKQLNLNKLSNAGRLKFSGCPT